MAEQPIISARLSTVRSGDECPEGECNGRLFVYASKTSGETRIRYLKCDRCQTRPAFNKERVPEAFISHRRRRDG
jgi:hypothetical protein